MPAHARQPQSDGVKDAVTTVIDQPTQASYPTEQEGFSLRCHPHHDNPSMKSLTTEVQRILMSRPGTVATILLRVQRQYYANELIDHTIVWHNQEMILTLTYVPDTGSAATDGATCAGIASGSGTVAGEGTVTLLQSSHSSLVRWLEHNGIAAENCSLSHTLRTAHSWEAAGTFLPCPHNNQPYRLGDRSRHHRDDTRYGVCCRLWWSAEHSTFIMTECWVPAEVTDTDPREETVTALSSLQVRDQIVQHAIPCSSEWELPLPVEYLPLALNTALTSEEINLRQGKRLVFLSPANDQGHWHDLLVDLFTRAVDSGLTVCVVTPRRRQWLPLQRLVGRDTLVFIEDTTPREPLRSILVWDMADPPSSALLDHYSHAGALVWTSASSLDAAAVCYPHYVVECSWDDINTQWTPTLYDADGTPHPSGVLYRNGHPRDIFSLIALPGITSHTCHFLPT